MAISRNDLAEVRRLMASKGDKPYPVSDIFYVCLLLLIWSTIQYSWGYFKDAVRRNQADVVNVMLDFDEIDLHGGDMVSHDVLHIYRYRDILLFFSQQGWTIIHHAADIGSADAMAVLLKCERQDVNIVNKWVRNIGSLNGLRL
jgi:hypothetical protein